MRPLALALVLLLAGCTTSSADVEKAEEPTVAAEAGVVEETVPAPAEPTERTDSISFSGALPTFVTLCTDPTGCPALPPGADFRNRVELPLEGTSAELFATLTWSSSSAFTEQLSIAFFSFTDSEFTLHGRAMGPSPLVLEVPEAMLLAGGQHMIGVGAPNVGTDAAFARGSLEQPFVIEGSVTSLVAAPSG